MMRLQKSAFLSILFFTFTAVHSFSGLQALAAEPQGSAGGGLADAPWPMFQHDMFHTSQTVGYGFDMKKAVVKFGASVSAGGIASPVIGADGTVYVGSFTGCLFAVDQSGSAACIYGELDSGVESTPVISRGGIIYVGTTGGYLYAITTDGEKLWSVRLGDTVLSSPAVGGDGLIYVGSGPSDEKAGGIFYCISADGDIIWEYETGAVGYSSPAVDQYGNVYVASAKGVLYAFDDAGDLLWTYDAQETITSSPVISLEGEAIYFSTAAQLMALDYSGLQKWAPYVPTAELFGIEEVSALVASPALDEDGNLYVGGILGDLHCLNAQGDEQWSVMIKSPSVLDPMPAAIVSSPVIDRKGFVYIFSGNCLYSVLGDDGEVSGMFHIDAGGDSDDTMSFQSSLALGADRTFYVASADGNLYAVGSSDDFFSISGSVEGQHAGSVSVVVRGTGDEPEEHEVRCNAQGQYTAAYLYPGTYLVSPQKPGLQFDPPCSTVTLKRDDKSNINFTAQSSGPAIIQSQALPSKVANNGTASVLLTAQVVHYAGQDSIASVQADLSELGGSADQEMDDAGASGDEVAGDGIYSRAAVITPDSPVGPVAINITATDTAGLSARTVITFQIINEIVGIEPGEYAVVIAAPGQKLTIRYSLYGISARTFPEPLAEESAGPEPGFALQVFMPDGTSPVFEDTITSEARKKEFADAAVGTWVYKVVLTGGTGRTAAGTVLSRASAQYSLTTTTAGTGIVFGSVTEVETGEPVTNAGISTSVGGYATS